MNYHRNCSASGMFVFNSMYLVLWNCGATIWFYAATQQQRQYSRRCHCFVLSAVINPLCGGAGSLFCTLKPAAFSSFFILLFFICYFHFSCDRHMYLYLILLYFEYGPSLFSVVGLE